MVGRNLGIRNSRLIAGVAFADFVLAMIVYRLDGAVAVACGLVTNISWVILVVVRLVILAAHWSAACVYVYEGARLLGHSLQLGAFLIPLLHAIRG